MSGNAFQPTDPVFIKHRRQSHACNHHPLEKTAALTQTSNVLLNTRVLRVDQDNAVAERKLNRQTLLKIQLLHPLPLLGCGRAN
jgi:hypothetical protein